MANPIGISFLPSTENQAQGPRRQGLEGGGGDLSEAWKILSLQLPRVLGARALAPKRLLTSQGSAGMPGNPSSAAFMAMIQAMLGGQPSALSTPERGPSALGSGPGGYGDFSRNEPRAPMPRTPQMMSGGVPAPLFQTHGYPEDYTVQPGQTLGDFTTKTDPLKDYYTDESAFAGTYGSEG